MDESSFEIDSRQVAEASARFPAHRRAPRRAATRQPYQLGPPPSTDFARRAWDEGGRP